MEKISDPKILQTLLADKRRLGKRIGFVPTMGALHEGHLQLVERARRENDLVVVSIFVNPTQFNQSSDLEKYPRTLEQDALALMPLQVDYLFTPEFDSMYPDNYNYSVQEKELTPLLCGQNRPGHFQGVLTVVMKLMNIVSPQKMYMGEKDFQQYRLIQQMAEAFFMPVEVVGVPTVRDAQGLALSSRNRRLSDDGLLKARRFAKILKTAPSLNEAREDLKKENIEVDYLEEVFQRRFAAVNIEGVRLIDNVER